MISEQTTMRVWASTDVDWGTTLCDGPSCLRPAVLLWEFDEARDEGVPVCDLCADRLLERWVASQTGRVGQLPDVFGREPRPRRLRGVSDSELWNRSPELWLLENGWQGEDWDPDWDIPF